MLEDLRAQGYAVFHDIPGDGFNVDHALIGPAGIFAIETKTRAKPADLAEILDTLVTLAEADRGESGRFGGRLPEGDDPWA